MVATILWTIYLAITLILTVFSVLGIIMTAKESSRTDPIDIIMSHQTIMIRVAFEVISCILWAIWYMYFLH